MKLLKFNRFVLASFLLILYVVIINRASYLYSLVDFLFILSIIILYKIQFKKVFGILVLISFFYLVIGILNSNRFEYIFTDFLSFTPLIFLVLENENFKNDFLNNKLFGLNKILPYLIIASVGLFIYMGYDISSTLIARFAYDSDSKLTLFAPLTPIFFVSFIICYKKTIYNRFFAYLGALLILFMGFITQTKTVFIPIIFALVLRTIFGGSLVSKIKFFLVLLFFISIILLIINKYIPESLSSFTDKFNSNNDSNTDRIEESMNYLRQCNVLQLLFGKGFGGIKIFHGEDYIGGVNMIHFGVVHLIMKGGILLLALMYFPLIYIIVNDSIGGNYSYVSMAIVFMIMDIGHTQWISLLNMLMYWILVYFRFYRNFKFHKQNQDQH